MGTLIIKKQNYGL